MLSSQFQMSSDTRDFFYPIHRQAAYAALCGHAVCPVADRLGERGFYLPSGPGRTDAEVDQVVAALKDVLARNRA